MNKKQNPKTRKEVNRQYYLKNKKKRQEQYKVNYDKLHEGRYYIVKGVPVWKQVLDEVEYYFQNESESVKNNARLAIAAMFSLMDEKEYYERVKLFSTVIRKMANGISSEKLNKVFEKISNDNGYQVRRGKNKFFLSVAREKKTIKNKIGEEINVWIRNAVPTRLLNKEDVVDVEVKMTENCFKSWGLLTWKEVSEKKEEIKILKYDNYDLFQPVSEYNDSSFEGFHIEPTESELEDIENYKKLRVDVGLLEQLIEKKLKNALESKSIIVDTKELEQILSGEESGKRKMKIEYKEMLELSQLLKTLTPKNGLKITFRYGRMYFPFFTRIGKDYRYLFHKKELFDVPTCYSTFNMIHYSRSVYRDETELARLFDVIMNGDFYTFFGDKIGLGREEMKPLTNSWYFSTKGGRSRAVKLNKDIEAFDKAVKKEFPSFYQFIWNSVDEDTKKGKKNVLSVKNQWKENEMILNGLFKEVFDRDKVNVQDAIYVDENYIGQSKEEIKIRWKEIVTNIIFNKERV